MDLSRNLAALNLTSLDKTSLSELESKADRYVGIKISKQQVLNTYLGWLREQLVQDMFIKEDSLLETWTKSLRSRGFDREHIQRSFNDWQRRAAQDDPSTRRRFLMVEEELHHIFNPPRQDIHSGHHRAEDFFGRPTYKENKSPAPEGTESHILSSKSNKVRGYQLQRTGANDTPVINRRPVQSSPTRQAIESVDSGPTEPSRVWDAMKAPTLNTSGFPTGALYDPDEIMVTRETMLLDTPPKEVRVCLPRTNNSTAGSTPTSKLEYLQGLKSGNLEQLPPGPQYVCKRCHWVHLCPTNLDPSRDVAPPHSYTCNFCSREGHHFATLCPHNENEWSLTQQRKKAGIQMISSKSRRRRSTTRGSGDLYRPEDSPRSRREGPDKLRPDRQDVRSGTFLDEAWPYQLHRDREVSLEPLYRTSPLREGRERLPENTRRSDRYRPEGHRLEARDRPIKSALCSSKRDDDKRRLDINHTGTEGRLSYEDDVFTMGHSPLVAGPSGSPRTTRVTLAYEPPEVRASEENYATDGKRAVSGSSTSSASTEACKQAGAEADDFLQALRGQIQDNSIAAICVAELDMIIEETCSDEDPNLVLDKRGTLCKLVTKPEFSDEVVRLFANRSNPVVNPRPKRNTATEVWEEAEQKAQAAEGMHHPN
ncbi:hypothetical protein BJ170DRAFT_718015 [Xylariales sp. AK1849]|nr:hypothetical protein BJ170DRAFT_718015 [Xylariales sp. AK1849]